MNPWEEYAAAQQVDKPTPASAAPWEQFAQAGVTEGQESDGWGTVLGKHVSNLPEATTAAGGGMMQAIAESPAPALIGALQPAPEDAGYLERLGHSLKQRAQGFRFLSTALPALGLDLATGGKAAETGKAIQDTNLAAIEANQPYIAPEDWGKRFISDATNAGVQMAVPLAAAVVTRNPAFALAPMGAQTFGDTYGEQRRGGSDPNTAFGAALGSGVAEAATEMLPLGQMLKAGTPFLKRVVATALGEGVSESVTQMIQDGIRKGTIDPAMTWSEFAKNAGYAAALGTVVGAPFGALSHPFAPQGPLTDKPGDGKDEKDKAAALQMLELLQSSPDLRAAAKANAITDPTDPRLTLLAERLGVRREQESQRVGAKTSDAVSMPEAVAEEKRLAAEREAVESGDVAPEAASTAGRVTAPERVMPVTPQGQAIASSEVSFPLDQFRAEAEAKRTADLAQVEKDFALARKSPEYEAKRAEIEARYADDQAYATLAERVGSDPAALVESQLQIPADRFRALPDAARQQVVEAALRQRTATQPGPVLTTSDAALSRDGAMPAQPIIERGNPDYTPSTPTSANVKGTRQAQPTAQELEQGSVQHTVFDEKGNPVRQPYARTAEGTSDRPFVNRDSGDLTPEQSEFFRKRAEEQAERMRQASVDELLRRWKAQEQARQKSGRSRNADAEDRYGGNRYKDAFTDKPGKQDADGRYPIDEFGFVRSAKGGPVRFRNQKDAAHWIVREGQKKSKDQYFDIENHPSGQGFAVRERGRYETPPDDGGPNGDQPNPSAKNGKGKGAQGAQAPQRLLPGPTAQDSGEAPQAVTEPEAQPAPEAPKKADASAAGVGGSDGGRPGEDAGAAPDSESAGQGVRQGAGTAAEGEVTFEPTAIGDQAVIPGAEKISEGERLQRRTDEPMRAAKPQKAAGEDGGLFDTGARNQGDLFSTTRRAVSTATEAFKRWFGKSKVVDATGKPLMVFKGMPPKDWRTGEDIVAFDSPNGPWAGFFTSDAGVAGRFADVLGHGNFVLPAYLSIEKPLVIDAAGRPARDFQIDASVIGKEDSPIREKLLSGKYDGLILRNTADEGDVFVPLRPTQIKSAFNTGAFDPANPDIRYSAGARLTPQGEASAAKIREAILAIARRINPSVTVEFADRLFGEGEALLASGAKSAERQEVAGLYSPAENLIRVSLDLFNFDPLDTAFHELMHSIEGMLTAAEKTILTRKFPAKDGVSALERRAIAFAEWALGGKQPEGVAKVFRKIRDFFTRLGNALQGLGFQTAEDIFQAVEAGQMAERMAQQQYQRRQQFDPQFSVTKKPLSAKDKALLDGVSDFMVRPTQPQWREQIMAFLHADKQQLLKEAILPAWRRMAMVTEHKLANATAPVGDVSERAYNGGELYEVARSGQKKLELLLHQGDMAAYVMGIPASEKLGDKLLTRNATAIHGSHMEYDPENHWLRPKKGSKPLMAILKPIADLNPELLDLFGAYVVARRARQLKREGREFLLSEDQIKAYERLDKDHPIFETQAKELQAFFNQTLEVAEKAGTVSKEMKAFLEKRFYTPFNRVVDAEGATAYGGRASPILQKLTGGKQFVVRDKSGTIVARFKGDKAGEQKATETAARLGAGHKVDTSADLLGNWLDNIALNTSFMLGRAMQNMAEQTAVKNLIAAGHARKVSPDAAGIAYTDAEIDKRLSDAGFDPKAMKAEDRAMFVRLMPPPPSKDGSVFTYYENGEKVSVELDDPLLFDALQKAPFAGNIAIDFLRHWKNLKTAAITTSPDFMQANLIRDIVYTFILAGTDKKHFARVLSGIREAWNEDEALQHMMAVGAGGGGFYHTTSESLRAQIAKDLEALEGKDFWKIMATSPKQGWRLVQRMGNAAEMANRLAVRKALLDGGASELEASYQAMDLLNFKMRGASRVWNAFLDWAPFLNAHVQALYRLGRGAASDTRAYKAGDKAFSETMMARGLMVTAASMAFYLAFNDDDDRYESLEPWERDTYWHLWLGEGDDATHITIPKPHELGAMFASMPEHVLRYAQGKESGREVLDAAGRVVNNSFGVNMLPVPAATVMQQWANKNSFTERPIEPAYLIESRQPRDRFDVRTSQFARGVGDVTGLSPMRLDAAMRDTFGTWYRYGQYVTDPFLRPGGEGQRPTRPLSDIPGLRMVKSGVPSHTKDTTRIYEMKREASQLFGSLKSAKASGDMDHYNELMADPANQRLLRLRLPLNRTVNAMGKIKERMRRIEAHPTMSGAEKRKQLDELQRRYNGMATKVREFDARARGEQRSDTTPTRATRLSALGDGQRTQLASLIGAGDADGVEAMLDEFDGGPDAVTDVVTAMNMPELERMVFASGRSKQLLKALEDAARGQA